MSRFFCSGGGLGNLDVDYFLFSICFHLCIFLSETYSIVDAYLYIPNPPSTYELSIPLPSSAEISFKMSKTRVAQSGIGGSSVLLQDSSHNYYVGNWASTGQNGLLIRNIGSTSNLVDQTCSLINANEEVLLKTTYDGQGNWTYSKDNEVKSFTANYTPTKLIQYDHCAICTMKDLIIKLL